MYLQVVRSLLPYLLISSIPHRLATKLAMFLNVANGVYWRRVLAPYIGEYPPQCVQMWRSHVGPVDKALFLCVIASFVADEGGGEPRWNVRLASWQADTKLITRRAISAILQDRVAVFI